MPGQQQGAPNWGPRIVDGVLGAASGGMPSWMMSPLAACLYQSWQTVGPHVFCYWLDQALSSGTGAPSTWREMQPQESR